MRDNTPNPLRQNPDFIADCINLSRSQVLHKWDGASVGLVGRVRQAHKNAMETVSKAAPTPGESSDVTIDSKGKRFEFVRNRPVTLEDARELLRSTGDDPDDYWISIRAIAYGGDKSSNKISAWAKVGTEVLPTLKLPELYRAAERRGQATRPARPTTLGTVRGIADWQIGKVGRRGGTPELLERLRLSREAAREEYEKRQPARILIVDGGDGVENFESGGNPMFTNDLSLPDQLDCYATEVFKEISLAHSFAPVETLVVTSNHAQWRKGKQVLGKPSDDFGIYVYRQVQRVCEAAGMDVTFHYPDEWDESACIDFAGTAIGAVHGSQFGPGGAIGWWEKQAFGAQAVSRADVMLSAHYHTFGAGVAGINPNSGRERMWIGMPTNDNGSDHYRQTAGRDSLPGSLVFDVTEEGFSLASLSMI